jgi:hypothetical protein
VRARLVPLRRAAGIGLVTAAADRAVLGATFAWLLVLAGVYAADAGAVLPATATTAVLLFPIAAWATAAGLAATSEDVRALLTAAIGRPATLLCDAVPALAWLVAAAALGVAAPLLFDPHPAPPGQRLLGLALHLCSGVSGTALAFFLSALRTSRGAQTLLIVAAAVASALVPYLPPIRPLLQAWSAPDHPAGPALQVWSVLGPVLLAAVLGLGTAALRRHRL